MSVKPSSAELQEQMRLVRARLTFDSDGLMTQAREQFNWRNLIAGHPWYSLGAAAAVGYFLVPRRAAAGFDQAALHRTIEQLVKAATAGQQSQPQPQRRAAGLGGFVDGLIAAAGAMLLRQGVSIVSQRAQQLLEKYLDGLKSWAVDAAEKQRNHNHEYRPTSER